MSDYRAIAGVSASLRNLLRDRMENPVDITIAPPDATITGMTGRRLNLYLFEINENGSLKNQEIPGHGHPGVYGHPPLSLTLRYLLTAYGDNETSVDADLAAQQILGDAMRVLHDFAIITPNLREHDDPAKPRILDPSLVGEFERIKLTWQPTSLEDFAKIWTALPHANFRRSVAYQVSVVQIESQARRRLARPVKTRRIQMLTQHRPEITTVYRTPLSPDDRAGDPRVKLLQEITIEGLNFAALKTWVRLGGLDLIRVTPVSDTQIEIAVPDDQYPVDADHPPPPRPIPAGQRLQPGPQLVEVLTERKTEVVQGGLDHGTVVLEKRALVSNQSVFMLVPEITSLNPTSGPATTLLTVQGKRLYQRGLASLVIVGDVAIEVREPRAGDPWAAPTDTSVQVPLTALSPLPTGQPYPARVQVNGAQSIEEGITFTLTP